MTPKNIEVTKTMKISRAEEDEFDDCPEEVGDAVAYLSSEQPKKLAYEVVTLLRD